jgi:hypothetical protein
MKVYRFSFHDLFEWLKNEVLDEEEPCRCEKRYLKVLMRWWPISLTALLSPLIRGELRELLRT